MAWRGPAQGPTGALCRRPSAADLPTPAAGGGVDQSLDQTQTLSGPCFIPGPLGRVAILTGVRLWEQLWEQLDLLSPSALQASSAVQDQAELFRQRIASTG